MIAMSEYVRALDGLWEESEDIIDKKDGMGSVGGTSHVGLESVDGDVGSFGLIAFGNGRRDSTACFTVTCHVRVEFVQ